MMATTTMTTDRVDAETGWPIDECAKCGEMAPVSDARDGAVSFTEALCADCRADERRLSEMDAFDIAYERACSRGWAD